MMQAKGKTGKIRLTGHLDMPADRLADIRAAFDAHRSRAGASDWARLTAGSERHDRIEELTA